MARLKLYLTFGLTSVALGLQGMIGHAGATAGGIGDGLIVSEFLHLAAAGLWLGALLPLWFSLRLLPPADATSVCERFSPIGLACVVVLSGTGLAQGLTLIGSVPALFGTSYGHIALIKIALFLLALVLAAFNRLWLTDRLATAGSGARRHLSLSIGVETCAGLAIVVAAAAMASSVPAVHATVVWPFSWQFSLITVNEDLDLRQDVAMSLIAIGGAFALLIAAMLARRFRMLALCVAALAIVTCGPSLGLLTIDAYPTSFQTSPTHFSAASIAHGQALFGPNCAACHGSAGKGDGPAAAALRIKPANLTMPHLLEHTDGAMYWWLSHGIDDPEGGLAMPGFGATLAADDLWALIDYVRAHNISLAMEQEETPDVPVPAPALPVTCSGLAATSTADLLGHVVHVVTGPMTTDGNARNQIPPQSGRSTVTLDLRDEDKPAVDSCVAMDPSGWKAYAVLANLPPDRLEGTEFLVDPGGWLRAAYHPNTQGGWPTKASLIAAIRRICATPVQQPNGDEHEHHH